LFGFMRLNRKQLLCLLLVGTIGAGTIWASSSYLRWRVTRLIEEVEERHDPTAESSAGYRIVFWKMSVAAIREAPVIGHGSGSITEAFRRQGSDNAVNPHNQIFAIGIQLGAVGVFVLVAMWVAHWRTFFISSQASWFGLVVVTQNIVSCLFNS